MAWSTIRKATEEDVEKLEQRARAFIARHGLEPDIDPNDPFCTRLAYELEGVLYYWKDSKPELLQYWKRIVKRALGDSRAEGIAYGYVGFHVD